MAVWYRIFGGNTDMPSPTAILEFLRARYASASGDFATDASGWYQADLLVDGVRLQLERYLANEEGIRAELNSWAAWLETREDAAESGRLMERMIQTAQLFTLQSEGTRHACIDLCGFLAGVTAGVYQIDGHGFFAAEGNSLVPE